MPIRFLYGASALGATYYVAGIVSSIGILIVSCQPISDLDARQFANSAKDGL